MMIPLVRDTISNGEIDDLADWLRTYPRLTKGELTVQYEQNWSDYLGVNHSVSVNSGSSAVMMILQALIEQGELQPGDNVVVPAVSWATDLAPVVQLGLRPVLCDCDMRTLSIDMIHLHGLVMKNTIKCVILVSVLGLVPDMDSIVDFCNHHNIILLEDACESFGSSYMGRRLGGFGRMSCFSTYFGHHLSTIEGGMVCTNDTTLYNTLKAIRSHGWERDVDPEYRIDKDEYFDSLYKFHYMGFNFRSTDLQAFLGINQLKRANIIVPMRNLIYKDYCEAIDNPFWKPPISTSHRYVSNFAFPVISPNRDKIVNKLIENDIETRPLICGSLGRQPFWIKRYGELRLTNADMVNDMGFYLPNNPDLTKKEISQVSEIVMENL
jgi:CDP-4-dehydro-6-deoxyglucose reductase, E1